MEGKKVDDGYNVTATKHISYYISSLAHTHEFPPSTLDVKVTSLELWIWMGKRNADVNEEVANIKGNFY